MEESEHRKTRGRGLKLAALTSLASKGGNIVLQILAIPMAYGVLGGESFGVFAMISTLITFVLLSELGVGPGLTNVLAKSIANEDNHRAREAFSTAFFLTVGLSLLGCLAVMGVVMAIPVDRLFGEKFAAYADTMRSGVMLGVGIVFVKMVSSLGDRARAAYQETFITNLYGAVANLTAGIVLVLAINRLPEVWFMIVVVNGSLAFALAINMIHLWVHRPHLFPRWKLVDPAIAKFLLHDGLAFCASLSLAPIAKDLGLRLILGHMGGPAVVAIFDILERLMVFVFGFVVMFTFPLWPALSDAAARRDFEWIRQARRRLYLLALAAATLFIAGLTAFGPWAIHIWLQGELTLSRLVLFAFSIYVSVHVWHHVHHIFLAGLDSIRLVAVVVLIELPFFFLTGYLGYSWHALPGLFLGLALFGLIASFLFPYLALQRMRNLEQSGSDDSSSPTSGLEPMATAAS